MNNSLISIITVVYNGVATLEQTILSVINQTYKNIEYIIIDGGSTDGTIDIIKKYEKHLAYWVSEPDKGIYDAMNKGIDKATGELIGIVNSGDYYETNTIKCIVEKFIENRAIGVFHGLLRIYDKNGKFECILGNHSSHLSKGMIEHPTCFVNKAIYDKYGFFDTQYKSAADYDFLLKLYFNSVKFMFLESVLANFHRGGMSGSWVGLYEKLSIFKKFKKNKLKIQLKYMPFYFLPKPILKYFLKILFTLSLYIKS
jgi:glycosyltransferase involved in cell wall biosynthesis